MSATIRSSQSLAFLEGGGEMGELTRAFDWASTPLGPPENWPTQLKTAVRLVLTSQHAMFIWWGPELIQFYNDAYRRSIGPERHPSALGQRGQECWQEIWDIIGPQIQLVMEGRGSTWHENALVPITRNGKREDVYWTYGYSPIDEPDAGHGVGGVLVVCAETSEQVIAQRNHLAERDKLAQFFQQAPGFMAMLRGPQHVIEMANPAYMQLVQHRDVLGRTVADALPDAVEQGYLDLLDEVYASGKAYATTGAKYEVASRNGSRAVERYVDFVYQPITDDNGQVTGIFVEGFDVTGAHSDAAVVRELYETLEQRVADAVAQRNILADVVEFADSFILVIDLCYYVLAINNAYADEFERIYGRRLKVGDHLVEMMQDDPVRQERIRHYFDRSINGEDFHVSETYDSPQGKRSYDVRFNALRDRSGKQVGAFAIVYDVTERANQQARLAEAEERVRQAEKIEAIGQLTGGVAHDFNNLLMVISGGLEVMDGLAPARREKVIAGMRQAVEKGAGLSRQLLAFSRRQPLRPEPVDLARNIGGMREMLERSLRGDIHVTVEFDRGLWPVVVDPSQLELVVLNLAVNARDAMPNGGTITIKARNAAGLMDEELHGDFVELSLADTGTGMLPEVLARVFEPFFTTKEIGKGSGLGLAQAHGFAHASGGAVRLESTIHQGTTVFLYLPRSENLPAGHVEEAESNRLHDTHPPACGVLLLVEDDNEVAALTGEMLRALGYDVTRVENADAALGALANDRVIDIVFSDVMMPGQLDGLDLSQEIKRRRPGLPVVLTTGHVEAARQKAESLGIFVLPKPYRMKDLEAALANARKAPPAAASHA